MSAKAVPQGRCAFCGADAPLALSCVLDQKWSRRFGGEPVVALDHGWYTTPQGERIEADRIYPGRFHAPYLRVLCEPCASGWVEEVRWRAEPGLLSLAEARAGVERGANGDALVRWALLTAMLAELLDGMPSACSDSQRDDLRRGVSPPFTASWFFLVKQRRPARLHLSQVTLDPSSPEAGMVQLVTVDLAHLTVLVVMSSGAAADDVVLGAALMAELGRASRLGKAPPVVDPPLDLSRTPHPHDVAVHRVCTTARAVRTGASCELDEAHGREHPRNG